MGQDADLALPLASDTCSEPILHHTLDRCERAEWLWLAELNDSAKPEVTVGD
ncbi:hypothetical protein FRUB_10121 [Fimbriiglobus ruber]|uniref:Uncharacterized protein n=1 Tax=Fimbriiglobus ruber TaxID=1908690 RepID=A0A225CXQ6_9BACT|nr:hypothetical protein FRUB_10121 [Fimbriiglobus ruber]